VFLEAGGIIRNAWRAGLLATCLTVCAAACNGGGGQGGVVIVLDGTGLTQVERDSVRYAWIFIDGDGDAGRATLEFPMAMGLKGGTYTANYHPRNRTGMLTITGELEDLQGTSIASSSTTVTIKFGNQVKATITLVGSSTTTGLDAGIDAGLDGGIEASAAAEVGTDVPAGCAAASCDAVVSDGCCPTGCTSASDLDCATCGNGVVDPGEACDPLTTCPSACPPNGCQLFGLTNAGTCQAACAPAAIQTQCLNGDGCCPAGCTSGTDSDCAPACGNKVVDTGELCDGDCPAACPALGCQQRTLAGSVATCDAHCVNGAIQTACVAGDGCCPAGCTVATDSDCAVTCGNGIVDPGETCDGNCPTACPAIGCRLQVLMGGAATCDARCVAGPAQTACVNKDGCCPARCNTSNDTDCVAACGNGVLEGGETCEVAPASPLCAAITCDDRNACTTDARLGTDAACNVSCTHSAISACSLAAKDGCCPAGCNTTNDADCTPSCGNGIVEPPEVCDTALKGSCPTACPAVGCTLRTLASPGTCAAACVNGGQQMACVDNDGCCPSACTGLNDSDCAPPNDTCANALNISNGGDFPFSLFNAKADLVTTLKCPVVGTGAQGDVFFTLTLPTLAVGAAPTMYYGYFDVFDTAGNAVNVSLEIYQGACPTNGSNPLTCAAPTSGMQACGTTASWPRLFVGLTGGLTYTVVARMANSLPGRYALRFQRVPTGCAVALPTASGMPDGTTTMASTCNAVEQYRPACATTVSNGRTYYFDKCPGVGVNASTCDLLTRAPDTVLLLNRGSFDIDPNLGCSAVAGSGGTSLCVDDSPSDPVACPSSLKTSIITNAFRAERGIVTITVDTKTDVTGLGCGTFGLTTSLVP